jgi:predicted MFS family arabinose efflux permease
LVIGLVEFSWAGSTLAGIPLVAVLIDRFGWRSPFFLLGAFGLLGCIAVWRIITADSKTGLTWESAGSIWKTWRLLVNERSALGAIGFAFFTSIANDNLFVVYGAWLEKSFFVSVLALGLGTGVIGLAELVGESLTAAFSDRIGLKRSAIAGQFLCAIAYCALPVFGFSLTAALCGLFAIFLIYEFTIVTALSLCTELMPALRATMMSSFFAAAGIGRVLGALIGGHIWLKGGIEMTGMVSALFSGLGLLSLAWGLRGWGK